MCEIKISKKNFIIFSDALQYCTAKQLSQKLSH